jgi:hypothetical protein
VGGYGGLLLKAASGALRGHEEGQEEERRRKEEEAARAERDLFTRLRLAAMPGVRVGEQPEAGTPLPEQPAGLPASMRAVARPKNMIELGRIALGGEETPVSLDPDYTPEGVERRERGEAEAQQGQKDARNKQAFEFLHGEDKDSYPSYVEGFEYADEVQAFLDDQRTARREDLERSDDAQLKATDRAERLAIQRAETRAFNMLSDGVAMPTVFADPQVREHLTRDDVIRLAREARKAGAGIDQDEAVETRLAALAEAGLTGPRAQALANDPVAYRQWERAQGDDDDVLQLLEGEDEEAPAPKRSGFSRIFGRDQSDPDAQIRSFIKQHPDATDEEIAAMLEGR